MKSTLVYFLFLGLAITFWSNALKGFFDPSEINEVIGSSVIFGQLLQQFPFFVQLVGFHDLIIALLLGTRVFPRFTTTWAAIWLGIVTFVFFSHGDLHGAFNGLEHAAPFVIAVYLSVLAFREPRPVKVKKEKEPEPVKEEKEEEEEAPAPEPPSESKTEDEVPEPPSPGDFPEPPSPPSE